MQYVAYTSLLLCMPDVFSLCMVSLLSESDSDLCFQGKKGGPNHSSSEKWKVQLCPFWKNPSLEYPKFWTVIQIEQISKLHDN